MPMKTVIANQAVVMTGNSFATCGEETNAIEGDAPLKLLKIGVLKTDKSALTESFCLYVKIT
jgi:hypothetical protein